jgi:hypothetical protein
MEALLFRAVPRPLLLMTAFSQVGRGHDWYRPLRIAFCKNAISRSRYADQFNSCVALREILRKPNMHVEA